MMATYVFHTQTYNWKSKYLQFISASMGIFGTYSPRASSRFNQLEEAKMFECVFAEILRVYFEIFL